MEGTNVCFRPIADVQGASFERTSRSKRAAAGIALEESAIDTQSAPEVASINSALGELLTSRRKQGRSRYLTAPQGTCWPSRLPLGV
jgi:hypothetical protein